MKKFQISIITPLGKIFDEQVESFTAPGQEGFLGVLANHAPLIAKLKEGILKIVQSQVEIFFKIGSGVLEVDGQNYCLILCDEAVRN